MTNKHCLAAIAVAAVLATPAHAWTNEGIMTAGGVGSVECTEYLNQLGLARQAGMDTINGINITNPWVQFALGYITGYNMASPGMYSVAASIAEGRTDQAILVMVEGFCRDNPTSKFGQGIIFMINELLPTAEKGSVE